MRCRLCGDRAGWRRWCGDCRALWAAWQANRGEGMRRLLDAFGEAGVSAEKVERFLEGEPSRGGGSVRDHIASEMANQLLDALGQKSSQDPVKTKKLRELGAWRDYDRWPED